MQSDDMILGEMKNPKVSYAAKYQDLDALVHRFFEDGQISLPELNTLNRLDTLLTRQFQVAQDYVSKMDKNSPLYAAAQDLLLHMYRCRNLIDSAHDKAQLYYHEKKQEKNNVAPKPIKEEPEVLTIRNVGKSGMFLMMSLMDEKQRINAERSFSEKEVKAMSPKERADIEENIVRAITAIHDKQVDSRRLNHILGLEHTRGAAR
ncbi:MAG: hypothetical protein IKV03_01160 [Alphaproteobacteria bacterium]|nr:hypothetical protein [Alphaproteobacteria bacterium]